MADVQGRKVSGFRIVGLCGIAVSLFWPIADGGGVAIFINLPSMVFVFGITFFLLLMAFGADFLRFIPDALLTLVSSRPEPNPRFADIAASAGRYIIGAGVIGMLVGLINMLRNLSSPDQIGTGMGIALITPLYAVVVSEIFCAFLHKAYSDRDPEPQPGPASLRNPAMAVTAVGFVIAIFGILLITFGAF